MYLRRMTTRRDDLSVVERSRRDSRGRRARGRGTQRGDPRRRSGRMRTNRHVARAREGWRANARERETRRRSMDALF